MGTAAASSARDLEGLATLPCSETPKLAKFGCYQRVARMLQQNIPYDANDATAPVIIYIDNVKAALVALAQLLLYFALTCEQA